MKRLEAAIMVGFICSVITCGAVPFAAQCDTVRSDTVRLHILANSDSAEDQALKLQVRDALLREVGDVFTQASDREEAVELAEANLSRVVEVAEDTLRQNGSGLPVQAQVVRDMFFTTRQYEDVVMPAGRYDAVRVLIGEAQGRNWWCVMFPPLCIPAAEQRMDGNLERVEAKLLHDEPEYEVRFAVVELYERIRDRLQERAGHPEEVLAEAGAEGALSGPDGARSDADIAGTEARAL